LKTVSLGGGRVAEQEEYESGQKSFHNLKIAITPPGYIPHPSVIDSKDGEIGVSYEKSAACKSFLFHEPKSETFRT